MQCAAGDALAIHEVIARCRRTGARVVRVRVVKVVAAVVDDRRVANVGVVVIHVTVVPAAGAIPRMERFSRAEREPANGAAIAAKPHSNSPVRTADESDKCRAIYRTRIVRTRAPAPAAADVRPTPVVEGGKSPRRIVDPRPSPGTDVVPVTVTVRCPAYVDGGRIPYRAVVRLFVP